MALRCVRILRSSSFLPSFSASKFTGCTLRTFSSAEVKTDAKVEAEVSQEAKVTELSLVLAEKEKEIKEFRNQHLRDLAEMENVRMRARKDVETERTYAVSSFAKSLLDVADNLFRASEAANTLPPADRDSKGVKTLLEGVQMTQTQLLNVFGKVGITKMDSMGQKFDPNMHEAIFEVDVPNIEPGHIGQVLKEGYKMKDRVLRAALVGTNKKK